MSVDDDDDADNVDGTTTGCSWLMSKATRWLCQELTGDLMEKLLRAKPPTSSAVLQNLSLYRCVVSSTYFYCQNDFQCNEVYRLASKGDAVALLAGQRTYDSGRGFESLPLPLRSGLGQATYTCVPLSLGSIIWYRPRGLISLAGLGGK